MDGNRAVSSFKAESRLSSTELLSEDLRKADQASRPGVMGSIRPFSVNSLTDLMAEDENNGTAAATYTKPTVKKL